VPASRRPCTELAANLFRATQAEDMLRREGLKGKKAANRTHLEVGRKVRQTIQELGGTMPENLPAPDKSIKQLERDHPRLGSHKQEPGHD
jgi:DNA-damage-inducible protein D